MRIKPERMDRIAIDLTTEEKQELKNAAKNAGMTVSAYVRWELILKKRMEVQSNDRKRVQRK